MFGINPRGRVTQDVAELTGSSAEDAKDALGGGMKRPKRGKRKRRDIDESASVAPTDGGERTLIAWVVGVPVVLLVIIFALAYQTSRSAIENANVVNVERCATSLSGTFNSDLPSDVTGDDQLKITVFDVDRQVIDEIFVPMPSDTTGNFEVDLPFAGGELDRIDTCTVQVVKG